MSKRDDQIIRLAKASFEGMGHVAHIPGIPLKQVMGLSSAFRDISLSSEDLWALIVYPNGKPALAITSKRLHRAGAEKGSAAPLRDGKAVDVLLKAARLDAATETAVRNFLEKATLPPPQEEDAYAQLNTSSFDEFVGKMKALGEILEEKASRVRSGKRTTATKASGTVARPSDKAQGKAAKPTEKPETPLLIDAEYIEFLRQEGDQFKSLIDPLKEDEAFAKALHQSIASTDIMSKEFGPEHVVLQDLIRIFQMCDTDKTPIREVKAQYALAYIFERLQNQDMSDLLTVERINEMVQKPKFAESIEKLKQAEFLHLPPAYNGQLLMPSLLMRLKHPLFSKCSSHYIRFANILMKADGVISPEEEEILKKINRLCTKPKVKLDGVKQSEVPEGETLEDVMKELNELIGLKNIKEDIASLINFLKIQKAREEQGLKGTDRTLHAVFMGPPGTGKTTIARMLARIYKHLGYIANGHLVETDRAGLVAGYVGQTAIKVDEVVKSSLDGVLFIDEAYALNRGEGGRDFGGEAVETLLKRMEDHRKDLVVIVAGYPNEMQAFIESNPGLQSRFNRYFKFLHYNGEELMKIFELFANKADFRLDEEAKEKLSFILDGMYEKKDEHFGNARVARNLFEECVARQANRIVGVTELTKEVLMTLTEPDIPPVKETIEKYLEFGEVK